MAIGNIYQRVNNVRKKVSYAQKTKTVDNKYKVVTHDEITAMCRNELIDNGIVIVPKIIDSSEVEAGTTERGTPIIRYRARFDIVFVNEDNPSEFIISCVEAHANDTGDKAPGKALSYATKSAMLKLFSIETGESDESRVESWLPPGDRAAISDEQVTKIEGLISEVVLDRAKFIAWLVSSVGTDLVEQIPQRKFDLVVKQLEGMRKKPKGKANAQPSQDSIGL